MNQAPPFYVFCHKSESLIDEYTGITLSPPRNAMNRSLISLINLLVLVITKAQNPLVGTKGTS